MAGPQPASPGRPPVHDELRDLIIRLGTENSRWGFRRVRGELRRLGHKISPATVRRVLQAAVRPQSRYALPGSTIALGTGEERRLS
ncbi:helix-turn-helix domain-containing protein [Streptomyces chiangmaiensis]